MTSDTTKSEDEKRPIVARLTSDTLQRLAEEIGVKANGIRSVVISSMPDVFIIAIPDDVEVVSREVRRMTEQQFLEHLNRDVKELAAQGGVFHKTMSSPAGENHCTFDPVSGWSHTALRKK